MNKLLISDLELDGQRVFLRVDFNVPFDGNGRVTDDTRIRAALLTINYAVQHGARLIVASHLSRPKGQANPKYSLRPVAGHLSGLLGRPVTFVPECIGDDVRAAADALQRGGLLLLENLRFHEEEEKNDEQFSRQLASLADLYVNDAFGTAHRAHASTAGITAFVKRAAAGFLMERELRYLGKAITDPDHPFVLILGGAKVSDKIEVIENMLKCVDQILIGGAMTYTFLKSQGIEIGQSLVENDKLDLAKQLLEKARARKVGITLPVDHVVARKDDPNSIPQTVSVTATAVDVAGLDIGPATIDLYRSEIQNAKMIVWNGPMGLFERSPFDHGTVEIARAVAESSATSIVGGGDSVAAVTAAGMAERITHISTGGGATLEFLAGIDLPGIRALHDK